MLAVAHFLDIGIGIDFGIVLERYWFGKSVGELAGGGWVGGTHLGRSKSFVVELRGRGGPSTATNTNPTQLYYSPQCCVK